MPRALILSPFATEPMDAGQRRRVHQVASLLVESGFTITFILYAFEEGWKTQANEPWLDRMRKDWGEVIVWPAGPKVGRPATNGTHGVDDWWDETLEVLLNQTFRYRYFDVVFVNNVWLSKAFDFVPRSTVKVLDTHDIFSSRKDAYDRLGIAPEFFFPDSAGEIHGIKRCDIALGIQQTDATWLGQISGVDSICLPYCPPSTANARDDYAYPDKVTFGFVGSNHIFNAVGLRAFLPRLKAQVGKTGAPVELRIGGNVCKSVEGAGPWIKHGYVANTEKFFADVDIVVAPLTEGSGFKVKVADALARGEPLLATEHAAIGVTLTPSMVARDTDELANLVVDIALRRPSYKGLRRMSADALADLQVRTQAAWHSLLDSIERLQRTVVYDLSGLDPLGAAVVLAAWAGAFHLLRHAGRQVVALPEGLIEHVDGLCVPGLSFQASPPPLGAPGTVCRWICVEPGAEAPDPSRVLQSGIWARALGHEDSSPLPTGDGEATFWHSISWDPVAQNALRWIVGQSEWPDATGTATVLVVSSEQTLQLTPLLGTVSNQKVVAVDIRQRGAFLSLIGRIGLRRVAQVIFATTRPAIRCRVVRDICVACGIPCAGVSNAGSWRPEATEIPPNALFKQFERYWTEVQVASLEHASPA